MPCWLGPLGCDDSASPHRAVTAAAAIAGAAAAPACLALRDRLARLVHPVLGPGHAASLPKSENTAAAAATGWLGCGACAQPRLPPLLLLLLLAVLP
jgi:hypothetical protein